MRTPFGVSPRAKGRFSAYEGSGVFEERTEAREGRFVSEPAECSGGSSPNLRGVGSDPWQEGFRGLARLLGLPNGLEGFGGIRGVRREQSAEKQKHREPQITSE